MYQNKAKINVKVVKQFGLSAQQIADGVGITVSSFISIFLPGAEATFRIKSRDGLYSPLSSLERFQLHFFCNVKQALEYSIGACTEYNPLKHPKQNLFSFPKAARSPPILK